MEIRIQLKNYRCFPDEAASEFVLRPGITAFIGANNSGKSSILRSFYELRPIFLSLRQHDIWTRALGQPTSVNVDLIRTLGDLTELFSDTNSRPLTVSLFLLLDQPPGTIGANPRPVTVSIAVERNAPNISKIKLQLSEAPDTPETFGFSGMKILRSADHQPIFDLQTLGDAVSVLGDTQYLGAFRNAINVTADQGYYDMQVGRTFIEWWRHQKSGTTKLQNEDAYKVKRDIQRIFGFDELEINPSANGQTMQILIGGKSYTLQSLGSGLAQFIVVLASVAAMKPAYILVDEPELNLHPSLQLDFVTTLASYASQGMLFATHNIGLARATADRIYSIQSIKPGISKITPYESTPRLAEFLGEMSFSEYRELGFDRVLLVEGATDIKTVQQLLRLYGKDHRVVCMHLGGNALINGNAGVELDELKRISVNISALIDSERQVADAPLAGNRAAFQALCGTLGIPCHVLERRAIENYFPERAVQATRGPSARALGHFEAMGSLPAHWAKSENWRIARGIERAEIEGTDLAQFLGQL
jgi:ABC-type cobalamin/Fe3+-siderophores transport system ATPase subunit